MAKKGYSLHFYKVTKPFEEFVQKHTLEESIDYFNSLSMKEADTIITHWTFIATTKCAKLRKKYWDVLNNGRPLITKNDVYVENELNYEGT